MTEAGGGGRQSSKFLGQVRSGSAEEQRDIRGRSAYEPLFVHVTHSSFEGIHSSSTSYWMRDVNTFLNPGPAPNLFVNLITLPVPSGQAADIGQLFFYAGALGPSGFVYNVADSAFAGSGLYRGQLLVNDKQPWDMLMTDLGGIAPNTPGFSWFNQNVLDQWGDIPGHLIVPENQVITVRLFFLVGVPFFATSDPLGQVIFGARISGRWITMQDWKTIQERQ